MLGETDFSRKRLLHCATWLLLAEMKRTEQEFKRAMSLWKQQQRERQRRRDRERYTVCRDGQIFLLGNIQVDYVFFW